MLASDVRAREIAQLLSLHRPTVRALQEIVARAGTLTDVDASAFGSPIDHAHWRDRRGLRPGAEIPDYLADVVDPTTGVVDDEQLSRKLDLLAGALRSQAYGRQFWAKARPITGLPPTRLS